MSIQLTQQQLRHISNLIEMKGVEFDDVKQEMTDHIASEVEEFLELHPKTDFLTAVKTIFLKYGRFYFMKIEEEKIKQLQKQSTKELLKLFFSFFTIPKFIFTLFLLISIYNILGVTDSFYYLLNSILIFILSAGIFLFVIKKRRLGKGKYIQLSFFNFFYFYMLFIPIVNFSHQQIEYPLSLNFKLFITIFFSLEVILILIGLEVSLKRINQIKVTYQQNTN